MPENGPALRDIHVPPVSPWWPWAPGWWVLLVLVVIALVVLVIVWRRRITWRRYVDATLADLRDARERHARDGDAIAFAAKASELVRRVARTREPQSVALSGEAWRAALARMAPTQNVSLLATLDDAKYRRDMPIDVDAAAREVEAWVRAALRRPSRGANARRASHVPA
ncbi:DUF4381 domain-containing protein [Luteibacter flocculans]|uniref:DUF4381 domain-containing protein n=1 Tax=Luteibacter flocculans TaxID=2780091 RepID=A0ABY4SZH9_9GAMM|nr:DUF4381 family protein [Luteibacter flocculans]URL58098.1 DUF4381 domain-containing protein [Luteibacter flocculans]